MPEAMASTCIALTCDLKFLFPSLVCARQALANAPPDVDVVIHLDSDALSAEQISRIRAVTGVQVIPLGPDGVALLNAAIPSGRFEGSRFSRATMLRLILGRLVDPKYRRVIYLDGDMQVFHTLAPLVYASLPTGHIMAVRDWNALHVLPGMLHWEEERAALLALGLPETALTRYFNTGMIVGDLAAWREIGQDALKFFTERPEVCRNHDQDAFNAVAHERVSLISARWNFLRFYMVLPVYRELDPAIVHYCYRPKPWDGPIQPWGFRGFQPYLQLAADLADVGLPWVRRPPWEMVAHGIRAVTRRPFADKAYRARLQDLIRQDQDFAGAQQAAA